MTFLLPKRYLLLPTFIAVLHVPYYTTLSLGPLTLHFINILPPLALLRSSRNNQANPFSLSNRGDALITLYCIFLPLTPLLGKTPINSFVFNSKISLIYFTTYLLIRSTITNKEDLLTNLKILALTTTPLALFIAIEKLQLFNIYSITGGTTAEPTIRNGEIRARGPYSHAILSGTVASILLLFSILIKNKTLRIISILQTCFIVLASASSGPIAGLAIGLIVAATKNHQRRYITIYHLLIPIYIILSLLMTRPPVYLISKIDFTGSSTSYYRSQLIDNAFKHLDEWWLAGTNYTKHWMPQGQYHPDPNHCDITSHYIGIGVSAGILPMALFIIFLIYNIKLTILTKHLETIEKTKWILGSVVVSICASMISVSFFDNSLFLVIFTTGCIISLYSPKTKKSENAIYQHN